MVGTLDRSQKEVEQRAIALQDRICAASCPMPDSPKALLAELRNRLALAWRDGLLVTPEHEVRALLKHEASKLDTEVILGGTKDFARTSEAGWFRRHDDALFNFAVTVRRERDSLALLAYNFELRFPTGMTPGFVRFDLNTPDHANQDRGMRCHLHPGNDDLQIPSPLMAPIEILELILYRCDLPAKLRK